MIAKELDKLIAAMSVAVVLIGAAAAHAATITVNTLSDPGIAGQCSLRDAIVAANTDTAVSGCVAGSGADTIVFGSGLTGAITLTATLPDIESNLTISGPTDGDITISGNDAVEMMTIDALRPGAGNLVALTNLTFANGRGEALGAIYNLGILTVANSTFSGNSASNGAAILSFGTLTVTDSTFSGNSALFGGAIGIGRSPFGDSLTVINSTFSGNSASGRGGAIYFNSRGTLTITNSTFSGNSAPDGGGITNTVGNATLRGAILAGPSSGGNCNGRMTDGGYNISDDDSCGFSATGSHNNTDPLLSPDGLADNGGPTDTIALQPASPAIDKIPPADCPATDQRGYSRPAPGQADCDIGAYELDAGPGPPVDCSTAQASKANLVALALPFVLVPEQVTGVSDSSGPYSVSIKSITQDKPISRSRLLCPDGVGVGTNTASVRPIKQGSGGLIYTLGFTATDTGGAGSCTGAVEVCVQDLFHQGKCLDTGESYDATKCPP